MQLRPPSKNVTPLGDILESRRSTTFPVEANEGFRRVHQEDTCQALAIAPTRKYQNDGGPGIRDIFSLLKTYSSSPDEDADTFIDSIAYYWLIAGTDAHGKNYALLLASQNQIRLAPLYDIASILPYKDIDIESAKFAMKIGGEYRLGKIGFRNWQKLAVELGLDAQKTIVRVDQMARNLTRQVSDVERRMTEEGITHPIIARLAAQIATRSKACGQLLADAR
jgi:serine/threonine-protein kinase HipA